MAYCRNCGGEAGKSKYCPSCGQPIQSNVLATDYQKDKGGVGYFFLGALLPIIGVILFIAWYKEKPKTAKSVGLGSLVVTPFMILFIIAGFAVPAAGHAYDNTQRDSILADALAVESAAKLYCSQKDCDDDQHLTWIDLDDYVEGIDTSYYNFLNNGGIIATKSNGSWTVDLEVQGTGSYEFIQGMVPSECDRSCVVEDID